jgi:AraC-like DNA-binding protein
VEKNGRRIKTRQGDELIMNKGNCIKNFLSFPKRINKGTGLRPVCAECLNLTDPFGTKQSKRKVFAENACIIVFCIAGKISLFATVKNQISVYSIPAGRFCVYSCPGGNCHISCASDECSKILQLLFPFETLFFLLGDSRLPPELAVTGTDGEIAGIIREITPPMNRTIGILKDALLLSAGSDLFILAKALELLWLYLSSVPFAQEARIHENDRKAIQEALLILNSNLETPPRLEELAHKVGMSASKFKNLFPKTCGMTPYGYLRKKRMEMAMYLLIQGQMNVTQVAMEVGYSSISHFAKAFFKEFDINPSQVRYSARKETQHGKRN